jgi:thiamine-phosphate pyrophosphorylase
MVVRNDLTLDIVRDLATVTDFFAFGDEIWSSDNPSATLGEFISVMAQSA